MILEKSNYAQHMKISTELHHNNYRLRPYFATCVVIFRAAVRLELSAILLLTFFVSSSKCTRTLNESCWFLFITRSCWCDEPTHSWIDLDLLAVTVVRYRGQGTANANRYFNNDTNFRAIIAKATTRKCQSPKTIHSIGSRRTSACFTAIVFPAVWTTRDGCVYHNENETNLTLHRTATQAVEM